MLCKILIINMLDYKFKRFIFNQELKTLGYNLHPNGTVDATEQEAEAILELAKKNHISLKLIRKS